MKPQAKMLRQVRSFAAPLGALGGFGFLVWTFQDMDDVIDESLHQLVRKWEEERWT